MLKFFNATLKIVPIRTAQSPLYHLAEMCLESHEKKTIYATNRNIVKIISKYMYVYTNSVQVLYSLRNRG